MYKFRISSHVNPLPDILKISIWLLIFSNTARERSSVLVPCKNSVELDIFLYLFMLLWCNIIILSLVCSLLSFALKICSFLQNVLPLSPLVPGLLPTFNFAYLHKIMVSFVESSSFSCSPIFVFTLDFVQSKYVSMSLFAAQ